MESVYFIELLSCYGCFLYCVFIKTEVVIIGDAKNFVGSGDGNRLLLVGVSVNMTWRVIFGIEVSYLAFVRVCEDAPAMFPVCYLVQFVFSLSRESVEEWRAS